MHEEALVTDPVDKPRTAFWRCLYTQGHDAALLTPVSNGWKLTGTAVFRGDNGPVSAGYSVEMDEAWVARRGTVAGFSNGRHFRHEIEKTAEGWMLDGRPNGLVELIDLDFGFTPATNFQQLRRANLHIGERAEFSVVWFDIGRERLLHLPQIYERRDDTRYWYESPTSGYQATLEIDSSGFVRLYPELWQMEDRLASAL